MGSNRKLAKLETVEYVDLQKFMGDWYVIANIPTFIEKGAVNAIESYRLDSEGRVKTTFTFRKDSVSGPEKNIILLVLFIIGKQMQSGGCNFFGHLDRHF